MVRVNYIMKMEVLNIKGNLKIINLKAMENFIIGMVTITSGNLEMD